MADGIILTLFGAISLGLGIANKGPVMWMPIKGTDFLGKRFINIFFGAICLFFGLMLLLKKK